MGGSRSTARTFLTTTLVVVWTSVASAQPAEDPEGLPPPQPQPQKPPPPPPPPSTLHPIVEKTPPPIPPPLYPRENRIFFGFSTGTGAGVIGGRTEALAADVATGFQWAPLHFKIELIALRNPRLGFGIAARLGLPLDTDTSPASAKAVMARGHYFLRNGLRISGGLGAGYIRYRVGVDGTTKDTMAAGPLLLSAGAGYLIPISKSWRVTLDATATAGIATTDRYAGVPNEHAMHVDFDVGLVVFR